MDEVKSLRVAYGGYQELAGVDPDLTTLGKLVGGGMPVGAFGGKKEIILKYKKNLIFMKSIFSGTFFIII